MGRFERIDIKLETLANELSASLTKDRPSYPEILRTFEERRIDWVNGGMMKAIIIQPNFEDTGVNSDIWNFINIALFDDGHSASIPKWIKRLVDQEKFENIERNIDGLLKESKDNLAKIQLEDLK